MITNTTQKSLALLLDEIEKDAKEDESLCPYALTTVPLLVKALRRAMEIIETTTSPHTCKAEIVAILEEKEA